MSITGYSTGSVTEKRIRTVDIEPLLRITEYIIEYKKFIAIQLDLDTGIQINTIVRFLVKKCELQPIAVLASTFLEIHSAFIKCYRIYEITYSMIDRNGVRRNTIQLFCCIWRTKRTSELFIFRSELETKGICIDIANCT